MLDEYLMGKDSLPMSAKMISKPRPICAGESFSRPGVLATA